MRIQMNKNLVAHNACLDELERALADGVAAGLNPVELVTDLMTRHLLSDERDPAHMNGLEFKELFELIMTKGGGG